MFSRKQLLQAAILPVFLTIAIILSLPEKPPRDPLEVAAVDLIEIEVETSDSLARVFSERGYEWPPAGPVPPLALQFLPGDLGQLRSDQRKALFFQSLLPLVLAENQRLRTLRERAQWLDVELSAGRVIDQRDQALLARLFERYRIEGELTDRAARKRLMGRLDTVPVSLALGQAAKESGWGTSRFSREANNLFGQWTWDESVGVVPANRREGGTHFVRRFPDLRSAVRYYIWNLNVGHAYGDFRRERQSQREAGQELDGLALASTLTRYSERGEVYTREIRGMIRFNGLQLLDEQPDLQLAASR